MTTGERDVPFGLAGLVVAASLLEALRKRGLIDAETLSDVMDIALVYMQAFGTDHPPEVEQETRLPGHGPIEPQIGVG